MKRFTGMKAVFRREFKAYFSSPLGYVYIVIFLVASGFLTLSRDFGRMLELRQADLAPLRESGRLGEFAVVYRVERMHQGGGYGDQGKHPLAWAVAVSVDNQLCRVFNARGAGREWNNIDRLGSWLREQGFWYWWTRNDLEPIGNAQDDDDDPIEASPTVPNFIDPPFSPF